MGRTFGWYCADVVDVREDDPEAPLSECELCGCGNVRYEHIMEHEEYFEPVTVGCICAGIMEGDILKAKERERLMRNRAKRRRNFVRKAWKQTSRMVLMLGGRIAFVEVKAPGEKPRPLQLSRHRLLRRLGFRVYVLDGAEQIETILREIGGESG